MFILRTVWPEQANTANEAIGDYYEICYKENENFDQYIKNAWPHDPSNESIKMVVGFLVCGRTIPLYYNQTYYIMTDTGKTFEKIKVMK